MLFRSKIEKSLVFLWDGVGEREKSGVVKEIVAQNGQPVEYGQILMVLE